MEYLIRLFENISEYTGKFFAWSTALLVAVISVDVLMRYVFNHSYIWIIELEIYFFATSFLFGAAYAFKHDKHVRVDLFYCKFSKKGKSLVNLIGGICFLLPWCIISIMVCFQYAMASLKVYESSAQPGGLPAVYLLKFCLVIGFTLLLIQGLASILRSIKTLTSKEEIQKSIHQESTH